MMRRNVEAAFMFVLVLSALAGAALAHSGATGIVKQRMDSMKSIAGSTKAISRLDWQQKEEARQVLRSNAETIRGHASHIVKMFPEGSIEGPSEAVPAIWERPDAFAELARRLEMSASDLFELADTARSASDIAGPLGTLTSTCKSCHADFRKKK